MKILMVMAHCDDEVLWGFPILQSDKYEKRIIFLSNDRNNPERKWCAKRFDAARKICEMLGLPEPISLNYESEFYRAKTRDGSPGEQLLKQKMETMRSVILAELKMDRYDAIFAHNPIGEYGHIDHMLAHVLAMSLGLPVIMTDIFVRTNWTPYDSMPCRYLWAYIRSENLFFKAFNNMKMHSDCKRIYRKMGCWTWSLPPVESCGVYVI